MAAILMANKNEKSIAVKALRKIFAKDPVKMLFRDDIVYRYKNKY
jgi:hypothetical protein